ncbi:CO(2)-response secreted protease-like [Lycium ferocissimum]|uniref:CO(2)-response secreted protease-like n=1 Tax=Lycium ferocissimum TaxID=112874 RepID=UPI002815019C|nr:CO(2)-response secreted protease-like [Lycium ferocissimum]
MKKASLVLWFCLFLISFLRESKAASQEEGHGVYIVYMGAKGSSDDQLQLMSSLTTRRKNAVVHSYKNSFSGFAARLSDVEVQSIAQQPGVVSVFPDPVFQLHTTRSWDFLNDQYDLVHNFPYSSGSNSSSNGADTIIGIFDSGIWPESESFNDKGIGSIPSRWKGTCTQGYDFNSSSCNRKLIGARFYDDPGEFITPVTGTPRDHDGHGTHVAATAAGSPVGGASYYGLAEGTAKGGSPGSRIAVYRICTPYGCSGSAIMKAFDDAIADGVDIINLSIGQPAGAEDEFSRNPIAIGSFHAIEKGIFVVGSAGNDGPLRETVVNVAPWIFTVAATTIDRNIETYIPLGGNKLIKGGGISFSDLKKSPVYPLVDSVSVKLDTEFVSDGDARDCEPDSLDESKAKGKIIVCEHLDDDYSLKDRLDEVKKKGGTGFILIIPDDELITAPKIGSFPGAVITQGDGIKVRSYINSTRNPVATILPTVSVDNFKPAPVVASFSSRGPAYNTRNLLKPDIAAPGTAILAAWPSNDTELTRPDQEPPVFNIVSGTSMSCAHVSAIVATLKSQNPTWSPSAIRSAIMTTAFQQSNSKSPMIVNSAYGQYLATPYDFGAGVATMSGPLKPGLVYETEITDYLQFLCSTGYNTSTIKLISNTLPNNFSCPDNSTDDSASNMNYPSIAISMSKERDTKEVTRTLTRIGDEELEYTAIITAPDNLRVRVSPKKLKFMSKTKKLSYQVSFKATTRDREFFGSIIWTNGKYKVRSPFVVSFW